MNFGGSRSHSGALRVSGRHWVCGLVTALVLTWPLVDRSRLDALPLPTVSPGAGDLARKRRAPAGARRRLARPVGPGRISDFNAQDGLRIRWGLNLSSFSSTIVLYGLAALVRRRCSVGLFTLGGFVGSGLAMFLLARKLTDNAWIGLIAR